MGREEEKLDSEDLNHHQELILEPNIDAVRKRQQFLVDMNRQVGREEKKHVDDEEVYVHNLSFREVRPKDPAEKKVAAHDFGRREERFKPDFRREYEFEPDEVILDQKLPEKKIKGAVEMGKDKEERFPQKLNKDPFYEDQPLTELKIDVDNALKATKPNVPVVDFKRYEKTKEKHNLDLKVVME